MTRYTIHFDGRVQGVGFRYTTRQLAGQFEIAGYVQNLDDGRVLLVMEGQEAELDRFMAALLERMRDYIKDDTVAISPATGEFGPASCGALTIRS